LVLLPSGLWQAAQVADLALPAVASPAANTAVVEPSNAQVAAITTNFFIFGRLLYDDGIRFRRPAAGAEQSGGPVAKPRSAVTELVFA
jgi:hypothetical protein